MIRVGDPGPRTAKADGHDQPAAPLTRSSEPYRFAEIAGADPRRWVFLAREGAEVDALLAAGSLATGPPPDRPGWIEDDFAEPLRGRRVAILGRDDEFGRLESARLAEALRESAQEVRIVAPPGLKPRQSVGEWLQTGFKVDHLHACVELAPSWPPARPSASVPRPGEGFSGFSGSPPGVGYSGSSPGEGFSGSPPQPRPIRGDLRPVPEDGRATDPGAVPRLADGHRRAGQLSPRLAGDGRPGRGGGGRGPQGRHPAQAL